MTTGVVTTTPADEVIALTWAALANGETGDAAQAAQYPDKSVQVIPSGGFTSMDIQGSNDGTTWALLHDSSGAALSFTAAGIKFVLENTLHIRPANLVSAAAVKIVVIGRSST